MVTIVYYTSNRGNEAFEQKVRDRIARMARGIPIISVSQEPIKFGKNICVGNVGTSDHNVFRQLQIGCQEAKTPLIYTAESDCLYPRGYFRWIPPVIDDCYRYGNVRILIHFKRPNSKSGWFWRKHDSLCAQVAGRKYLLGLLEKRLEGSPQWITKRRHEYTYNPLRSWRPQKDIYPRNEIEKDTAWKYWNGEIPVIHVKTPQAMNDKIAVDWQSGVTDLPYWGWAKKLEEDLFGTKI